MRGYRSFAVVIIASLFLSCPDDPPDFSGVTLDFTATVPQAGSRLIDPDFAGVCHSGYSGNLEREYEMLDEMGVVWLHRDFSWSRIQRYGKDDWGFEREGFDSYVQTANAKGKKIIGMLLYDTAWVHELTGNPNVTRIWPDEIPYFCDYAVETVKRYNGKPDSYGKVDAWFIWNEPNLAPRFWTDDPDAKTDFFALTRATADAIRELDAAEGTATTLVGGVFSILASDEWVNGLFESGAMDKVDGIGYHPYGANHLATEALVNSFKRKIEPYGFADKIWANEVGYPTYLEKEVMPEGRPGNDQWEGIMPEITAKTIVLLATAGAKNFAYYHLFDSKAERDENNASDWHGLIWQKSDDEWVRKGGYWAYALCAKHLPGKTYQKMNFPASVPEDIHSYYFAGSDGSRTLIVWNSHPLAAQDLRITLRGSNHQLWNLETGKPVNVGKTSTHTLDAGSGYGHTMIFLTWKE